MKSVPFNTLLNETLTSIHDLVEGCDVVTFVTKSGKTFQMYHERDCCEYVEIEEIHGDVEDLIGSPILLAEEVEGEVTTDEYGNDQKWTFYKLSTIKGSVTIRWLGTSNGYYSVEVDFFQIK